MTTDYQKTTFSSWQEKFGSYIQVFPITLFNAIQQGNNRQEIFLEDGNRHYANHKVILVTSALPMPRSIRVFQRLGLNPIRAPSSYNSGPLDYNPLNFLPSIGSFSTSNAAIHEWIGIVGYRLTFRYEVPI